MPPATPRPRDAALLPILKDALVTGAIALALALPLVGFKTVDRGSTTLLETRFGPMLCGVSVIALGRLAFSLINAGYARAVFAVAATMAATWPLAVVLGAAPGRWLPRCPPGR
jgi:branched-chain amino acid transport system permease protein